MADLEPATDEPVAPDVAPEPELLHGAPVTRHRGQRVLHPPRERLVEVVRALRDEGWLMCLDVAGVDYLAHRPPATCPRASSPSASSSSSRSSPTTDRQRLRLRVQVPEADPVVPTLFEVHPGTEAMEREVFDMFGIRFDGHPDLTRILMPEDWHGHPLRKDYAVGRIPVQFKDAPSR